jgi:hypothetical protein
MAKFEEIERNSGVDRLKSGAGWIMVPNGKSNIVRLTGGAGFGLKTVEGANKVRIAEIHKDKHGDEVGRINVPFIGKDDKLLRITGLHQGPGKIVATKGSDKAELEFSVHGSRTFNVSFFFLSDLDGQNRSTPRSSFLPKDATGWVEQLNQVYGPQANIWFELGKNMPLAISGLDKVVTSSHAKMLAEHKDTQVASGKTKESKAPIRVFLAGPELRSDDKSEPLGFYNIPNKVILLKDQKEPAPSSGGPTSLMLKTLAHEIGHFLNALQTRGAGHDLFRETGYLSDILNTVDGSDIKISRQRVLDWNPT